MKKFLPIITLLLGSLGYIAITQIFFKHKHADFSEVYVADEIIVRFSDEKNKMTIKEPYTENGNFYVEISSTDEVRVELLGNDIWIDGVKSETSATILVKGRNILLQSTSSISLPSSSNVRFETVNTENTINQIKLSVGAIFGVLIAVLIVMKGLPTNLKVSITLLVVTVVLFLISSILDDMFWTMVSASVGWFTGLGLSKIETKDKKKKRKAIENIGNYLGNV